MQIEVALDRAVGKIIKHVLTAYNAFRNHRIVFTGGALVIIILLVTVISSRSSTVHEGHWIPVMKGNFPVDIVESGEIRAANSYYLSAPREWRMTLQITEMVPEGTVVKEGDVLVQFDASTLYTELDTAIDQFKAQEAQVLSVKTQQESVMSELESNLQMSEYSRDAAQLQLEQLKFESEVRKEDARLAFEIALIGYDETMTRISSQKIINESGYKIEQQRLNHYQEHVDNIKRRIDALTLRAPVSGMVVYNEIGGWRDMPLHKVAAGETVGPGMTVMYIPDLNEMESVIRVNEIDASKIKIGYKARLRLDAFIDRVFNGTVISIAPLADRAEETSQIKDFEIVIRIEESDQLLKPGMSAKTRIIFEEIPDALYAPVGAVFELDGKPVVFPQRTFPDPVPITTGKRNDRYIIVQGDIRQGDVISLSSPNPDAHPLGWFADIQRKSTELEELVDHLNTMSKENINKPVIPKTQEPDERIKAMAATLEKAGCPLTAEQIKMLTEALKSPEGFKAFGEILTDVQQKVLRDTRGQQNSTSDRPARENGQRPAEQVQRQPGG
ncbi:efflux RND transporter periplasmic adaptor subunit [bacterium]|nr:efflux RND transporter periplasmic adaptor subunit [bacterium]